MTRERPARSAPPTPRLEDIPEDIAVAANIAHRTAAVSTARRRAVANTALSVAAASIAGWPAAANIARSAAAAPRQVLPPEPAAAPVRVADCDMSIARQYR